MKKTLPLLLLLAALLAPQAANADATNPLTAQLTRFSAQPLDAYRYDWARKCTGHAQPGALALQDWLGAHVPGVSWGIYSCRKIRIGSTLSLHAEGRAVDWHLNAFSAADRATANRLIAAFLAPDAAGNPGALARRMGIQEVIWNCRIWSANQPAAGMRPYNGCRPGVSKTNEHKDHLHIGMNWRGAKSQSSFWRLQAPATAAP
jgi:hypothetical protein